MHIALKKILSNNSEPGWPSGQFSVAISENWQKTATGHGSYSSSAVTLVPVLPQCGSVWCWYEWKATGAPLRKFTLSSDPHSSASSLLAVWTGKKTVSGLPYSYSQLLNEYAWGHNTIFTRGVSEVTTHFIGERELIVHCGVEIWVSGCL